MHFQVGRLLVQESGWWRLVAFHPQGQGSNFDSHVSNRANMVPKTRRTTTSQSSSSHPGKHTRELSSENERQPAWLTAAPLCWLKVLKCVKRKNASNKKKLQDDVGRQKKKTKTQATRVVICLVKRVMFLWKIEQQNRWWCNGWIDPGVTKAGVARKGLKIYAKMF